MALSSEVPARFWDRSHISVPTDFIPFRFNANWLSERTRRCVAECTKALWESNVSPYISKTLEFVALGLMNELTVMINRKLVGDAEARELLTVCLQSLVYCHRKGMGAESGWVYQLLSMRSGLSMDLEDSVTGIKDLQLAKMLIPFRPEAYLSLCKIYIKLTKWLEVFKESISLLSNQSIVWDPQHAMFTGAVVSLTRALARLSGSSLKEIPKGVPLYWVEEPGLWENLVKGFYIKEEYDGLGIITVGLCDNFLLGPPIPNIPIMKAASIPGIRFSGIDIGKVLSKLYAKGIRKWHLKMGEFFIQRGADIHTIASEFKLPLLVAIIQLSLYADTPSFLEVAWDKLAPEQFDETDRNLYTAFHWLASWMTKPENRRLTSTSEILCNRLLSNGCLPYLRSVEGRLPYELIPETSKLHRLMWEAVREPPLGLRKRLDNLTAQADRNKKSDNPESAIALYEIVVEVHKHYPGCFRTQDTKVLLKLTITYFKNKDFEKCRRSAIHCHIIEDSFDEVSGKTLYWQAKADEMLGRYGDAFRTYMEAFTYELNREDEVLMLKEGLKLLPRIPGQDSALVDVVNDYPNIWMNPSSWDLVVEVINGKKLWDVLKILYLGPPYKSNAGGYKGIMWDKSACKVDLRGMWDILESDPVQAPRLLLALVQRGANHRKLSSDPKEGFHAVVRFCALSNDTAILSHILGKKSSDVNVNEMDSHNKTALHTLSQLSNKKIKDQTLIKLAKMLCDAGCSRVLTDSDLRQPWEYATGDLRDWLKSGQAQPPKQPASVSAAPPTRGMKTLPTTTTTKKQQAVAPASASKGAETWRSLKDLGNKEYGKEKYSTALEFYTEALSSTSDKGKNKASGRDRAVILGNMTECLIKVGKWHEAFSIAMKCMFEDQTWFKAYLRLGRIVQHEEEEGRRFVAMDETPFSLYADALRKVEADELEEKNKIMVLSEILSLDFQMTDLFLLNCLVDGDLLVSAVHHCIAKESNWQKANVAHGLIKVSGPPSNRHWYDLAFLCKHDKLKDYSQMILDTAFLLSQSGSDICTLKFSDGDFYINALITIMANLDEDAEVEQWSLEVFLSVLTKTRRAWKDRHKACDDKGCTPLHHVAAIKGNDRVRLVVAKILLRERFDMFQLNKDKQRAVDLCRKSDAIRKMLEEFSDSRPKQAPVGGAKKEKQKPECDACEDLLKRATDLHAQRKFPQMYLNLVTIINEQGHDTDPRHGQFRKSCIARIVETLASSETGEIPSHVTQLCQDGLVDVVKALIEKKKWSQLQALVTSFKSQNSHRNFNFLHKSLPIKDVILNKNLCAKEKDRCKVVQFLFEKGGKLDTLSSADMLKQAMQASEFKIVLLLLNHGADPKGVTLTQGDTPMHAALRIALFKDSDNFSIFDWLTSPDRKQQVDWNVRDKHGNNLLHLAAKAVYSHSSMMAVERLCKNRVSVTVKNKDGKLPRDLLLSSSDRRAEFLRPKTNQSGSDKIGKSKSSHTSKVVDEGTKSDSARSGSSPPPDSEAWKPKAPVEKGFSVKQCRKQMKTVLTGLPDMIIDLFPTMHQDLEGDDEVENDDEEEQEEEENEEEEETEEWEGEEGSALPDLDLVWAEEGDEEGNGKQTMTLTSDLHRGDINPESFDSFPWEIECTEEVWNALKNQRKTVKSQLSEAVKKEIVVRIQQLAQGDWSLAKVVDLKGEPVRLYRVGLSRGFILLEVAVAFSPRLKDAAGSSPDSAPAYSEIIRVWNIVTSKMEAQRTLQRIILSHRRGEECYVKENLDCKAYRSRRVGDSGDGCDSSLRYPLHYSETGVLDPTTHPDCFGRKKKKGKELTLCPPASTGKMEFHILKFYSFTSTLVSAVLNQIDLKVDFPFKVTPLEHKIIGLPCTSPVLLLGRSGTGKTTICVHRLWKKFVDYWERERHHGQPLLPRDCLAIHDGQEGGACDDDEASSSSDKTEEEKETSERKIPDNKGVEELVCENAWMEPMQDGQDSDDGYHETEGQADDGDGEKKEGDEGDLEVGSVKRRVEFHHLHQVFVTKNQQLCSEVGKTFQRLRNSISFLSDHSRFDDQPLPNTLQDVEEQAFPLFVTSRQLLLLLDASLIGQPFFDRDENLDLKVNIPGWGTQEEIFHNIPLEGSSDEEFDDFDERGGRVGAGGGRESKGHRRREVHDFRAGGAIPKRQTDKKRECTYEVFAYQVWPKIAQKKVNEFHPSLVWTEIMSIIKGSYEALQTPKGFLSLEKYREVGQKRAPNFSGDRDEVYTIFKNYLKHKREKRLFDESDLVFNMYTRLGQMAFCPWVFDEIYVDELQDFTQAELTLLIALSHEPNKMFLTGDTAQSIMHGISFRFRDLKSLFYFARESQSKKDMGLRAIKPPGGVHPLRYNYRSHSGILSLASSVLDLLTRFFPESYDVLDRDQGLFDGPKPVLIESCSQTDLALLLSGNQRKTSHIEFGAHQAILVSSQQAKDDIPPDLKSAIVLTIYESKGLEFDDILLYNFFKDSQASKVNEWRVVTAFLNELVEQRKKDGNLDDLDSEILTKPCRPHPLTFNPVQHKILNTELKHLYTALTRARVNVWVFDEDQARSAPVFEYFRVLSLVKAVGLGDKDKGFGDQLFTKKSTAKEWYLKGDMFMKRKLYEPAAKCFGMAGDDKNQKYAQAHHLAQKAGQQKQTAMFLEAASLFVECERLHPAARCFHRAKESLLAALALEKNGEMKLAADQYKRLSKFVDASLCYERGGMFDLAMGVLVDFQEFERALDCLHRYHNIIKECEMEKKAVPQVVIDHRPRESHSEKHLLYMLAEDYLSRDNEEMMFHTVERLEELEDQFHFLLDKGYSERAARILEKMGRTEEAANLMLQENYFQDGLEFARRGKHVHMEASIHLTMAQIQLSPPDESMMPSDYEDELQKVPDKRRQCEKNARRALELFRDTDDDNGTGQALLVLGCLNKNKDTLSQAHRVFQNMRPPNVAGQIETFQEMFALQPFKTFDLPECKKGLGMIRKGTQVMKILRQPTKEEEDRHLSYLAFYGLDPIPGSDTVALNPNHFPSVSRKRLVSLALHEEQYQSSGKIHKKKAEVVDEIWNSLVADLTSWAATVGDSLGILTKDGCCDYQSEAPVLNYMESLCLKVELSSLEQTIMSYFNSDPVGQVQSVLPLLDFLPPVNQKMFLLDSKLTLKVLKRIRSSEIMKSQISRYLLYKWDNPDRVERGRSTDIVKERSKESDWLVQTCLFESLFLLDINVEQKAKDLEMDIMKLGKEWAKKKLKYAIFVLSDNKTQQIRAVESLGGRFIKSFQELVGTCGQPDPYAAIIKFTKLISVFGHRGEPSIMPVPEHLLFWLEFYVSLSFCFIGKSSQDQEATFYLPASYFHHFDVINACRGRKSGSFLLDVVKHKSNIYSLGKRILEQQDFLVNFLVGNTRYNKFSLLSYLSNFTGVEDLNDQLIGERIVVLCLVLLLNTANGFVNKGNRTRIHQALCTHSVPTDMLPRSFANLLLNIPNINGYSQLLDVMSVFLREHRRESLVLCSWQDKMAPPLHKVTLGRAEIDVRSPESDESQDFNTNNSVIDDEEPGEVEEFEELNDMEKMELERQAQQRQLELEREMKAAKIIVRFLRGCVLKSQLELEKNPHHQYEERYLFAPYVLSAHRCGICGLDLIMSGGVGEDGREVESQGQTKEVHETNDKHQSNMEQFKMFKQVYVSKVLKELMEISKFMSEYQVNEDSPIYANISIDVKKLMSELSAFHKNLKELMVNRDWSKHLRVTATFGFLLNTFQKNKSMIRGQYNFFQKRELDRQASLMHAQAMTDGLVEDGMDLDPYDTPLTGFKGQAVRGRMHAGGRGKGHRNRGGRGGHRGQRR